MNTKTLTISGFAMGAILMAGLPRPAAAVIDELLMYPGSNCIKQAGAGSPTFTSSGTLVNNTNSDITVQCPMYDGGLDFTGRVWVSHANPPVVVTCSSNVRNPLGTPNLTQTKSVAAGGVVGIVFDGPDVPPGTPTSFSYRFYNCTLPKGTTLHNYRGQAL